LTFFNFGKVKVHMSNFTNFTGRFAPVFVSFSSGFHPSSERKDSNRTTYAPRTTSTTYMYNSHNDTETHTNYTDTETHTNYTLWVEKKICEAHHARFHPLPSPVTTEVTHKKVCLLPWQKKSLLTWKSLLFWLDTRRRLLTSGNRHGG